VNKQHKIICADKDNCSNRGCIHKLKHHQTSSCSVWCLDTNHFFCTEYLKPKGEKFLPRVFYILQKEKEALMSGRTHTVILWDTKREAETWEVPNNKAVSITISEAE